MDPKTLELLHDNLIEPKDFSKDPNMVKTLECFHFNLPVTPNFSVFPGLIELRIIEQDVVDLNWLKDCKHLIMLTVYHTPLKDTKGLINIPAVKQLILEGNKLDHFPDISSLKNLVDFSVAENPIFEIDNFPKSEALQSLNLSSTGISYVSNTILNFPNLRKLQIAGNNLHDFSLFKLLSQLTKLQELYLYDPNYEENPICSFPNYDVLPSAYLPNLTILDTYKLSDKMKQNYQARRKQAELYYLFEASANMTSIYDQVRDFHQKTNEMIQSVDFNTLIDKDAFAQIYNIIYNYDKLGIMLEEFHRLTSTTTFQSGASISIVQLDMASDECRSIEEMLCSKCTNKGQTSLFGIWKVSHLATKSEVEEECIVSPDNYVLVIPESLQDSIKLISDWRHNQGELNPMSSTTINGQTTILLCDPRTKHSNTLVPEYICFYCEPFEDGVQDIEKLISSMKENENTLKETVQTEDTLVLFDKQLDFTPEISLVNVTLTHCGITSLSIFKDLVNVKELNLPFNEIETLRDLPETLSALEVLDVSYNKIAAIHDLLPDSDKACEPIKLLLIFGNPICSPKTINLTMQFFPQSMSIMNEPKIPLYVPHSADPGYFIQSIFPPEIQLETLTSLDFRNQCLVSLAPLSSLPNLKILYASDNMLTQIDFSSNTLTFGDFSLNSITNFPTSEQFPVVEALLVSANKIAEINPLQSLLALFISDNEVSELITQDYFPNLVSLSCNNNPLLKNYNDQRIIFSNPKLKMLNGTFITNQMANKAKAMYTGVFFKETADAMLEGNVQILDLSKRALKDVNCLESNKLIEIDLSNNNLATIKWGQGSLPNLKQLNLSGNSLINFDFAMCLPKLKVLDISSNKIKDEEFQSLCSTLFISLTTLSLSNNSIKTIPSIPQRTFPVLESINLSHNFINRIDPGAFEHPKLIAIDLSYNSLKKLDNIASPQIVALDLSHNRVSTVDEVEKLRPCTHIQKFAFNDNSLTQRIGHRIKCLSILRTVKEMDCRPVTESDLNQVRIILEQMTGGPILSPRVPVQKPAAASPSLPPLQGGLKKKSSRFPR